MIPNGWKREKLNQLSEINIGGTPSRKKEEYWESDENSGFPWVSIRDLRDRYLIDSTKEKISQNGVANSNVKLVPSGTIMMSFKLTIGRVAKAGVDLYTNEAIASFLNLKTDLLHKNFLFYILPKAVKGIELDQAVKGVTLNKKKLAEIPILLPPLPEQKKIADILTSVDEAIQTTQKVIDQSEKVKQGLLQELLTKGIGRSNLRVGIVPEGWFENSLGENLQKIVGGGTPSRNCSNYWDGDIPWATVKDLIEDYPKSTQEYITIEGLKNSSANLVPKKTIITATRMGLGRGVLFSQEVAINQDLKALFPKENLDTNYLFQWIKLKAKKLEEMGSGSTVKGIRLEILKAIPFLLPPLPEQKQIAAILSSIDESIQKARDKKSQLEKVKKGLVQDLLTGKVRVKV